MNQGKQLPSTLKFTAHSQKEQKRQYLNMKLDIHSQFDENKSMWITQHGRMTKLDSDIFLNITFLDVDSEESNMIQH